MTCHLHIDACLYYIVKTLIIRFETCITATIIVQFNYIILVTTYLVV
jgi:hypothetical protein